MVCGEMLCHAATSDAPYLSLCGGRLYLAGNSVKGLLSGDKSLNFWRAGVLSLVSALARNGSPFLPDVFVGEKVRLFDLLCGTKECSVDFSLPELFLSFLVDSFFSRATLLSLYKELWNSPPMFTGLGPYTDWDTSTSVSMLAASFQSTPFILVSAISIVEGSWTLFDGWRRPPRRSEILSAGVDLEAGLGINGFFPISVSEEDEWLLEPENFLSGLQKNNKIESHFKYTPGWWD